MHIAGKKALFVKLVLYNFTYSLVDAMSSIVSAAWKRIVYLSTYEVYYCSFVYTNIIMHLYSMFDSAACLLAI